MTYFIGIDISKFKHDFFIMDENAVCIHETTSFSNDKEGFNIFLSILKSLDQTIETRIGFESTGNYAANLKNFLDKEGYSYMEINPLLIKKFLRSNTLRKTKTDKEDAKLITLYLSTVEYKASLNKEYHLECLKSLTRTRLALIGERSKQLSYLTNALDKIFPEFEKLFKDGLNTASCMYLLHEYTTPSNMSQMNKESYDKMKTKLKRPISYSKFLQVIDAAKNTVGTEDSITVFELTSHLSLLDSFNVQIEKIECKIKEEVSKIPSHILSIRGIGFSYGAGIIAEIGDVNRFKSSDALLAYAGLDPSTDDSGTHDGKGKMVKRGSPYLRMYLMQTAFVMLTHNSVLHEYYKKKRNEGKAHAVALSHVAKKIVRIIYTLETKDIDFDLSKVR